MVNADRYNRWQSIVRNKLLYKQQRTYWEHAKRMLIEVEQDIKFWRGILEELYGMLRREKFSWGGRRYRVKLLEGAIEGVERRLNEIQKIKETVRGDKEVACKEVRITWGGCITDNRQDRTEEGRN